MSATIASTAPDRSRMRFIPELLGIHLEELEFLWGQRRQALQSTRYFLRDFLHLNERLEAHVQGLLAVPEALPDLLWPQLLAAENRDSVFAAACPLLRLANAELTAQIVRQFESSDAAVAPGFRDAFCFTPAGQFVNSLKRIVMDGDALHAAFAATSLANLRALDGGNQALAALLQHSDPKVAVNAWQASIVADAQLPPSSSRPYQQALSRPEAAVRGVAVKAAVWSRQDWLPQILEKMAASGDAAAVEWLAVVGGGQHGSLLVSQMERIGDLQSRCELLARFGHPGGLEILRRWMAGGDALLASHAGAAFTRITGYDVRGERIEAPVADDCDEFERELAPLIWTADLGKVDAYLSQNAGQLKTASRWSRGMPLDTVSGEPQLAGLDLQIRWDQLARIRLSGNAAVFPAPIFD